MKLIVFVILVLRLNYSHCDAIYEEDIDMIIFSALNEGKTQRVVTASGTPKIGVKLGNVTLEEFKNLPTQIWTLVTALDTDENPVLEMHAKKNEQNTITSYLYNGAHSHNQWKLLPILVEGVLKYFQLYNIRNTKCLNNKIGKLFYSNCNEAAKGQMWMLINAANIKP